MISKIGDRKITITPKVLKENEKHCEKCGGRATGIDVRRNLNDK